jgi:amino acid adenylation domain-containing protein
MNVNNAVASERVPELSPAKRKLLEERLRGQSGRPAGVAGIRHRADRSSAPLSYAQQRVWFFQQLAPESPLYNIPMAVRLQGRLNPEALQRALDTIMRRHEALHTRFVSEGGAPRQVVAPSAKFPLPIIDLNPFPASQREAEADRLLQAEAVRAFDLTQDLMLRATLIELDPADHMLTICTHHIASDGWSFGVLLRELAELYQAFDTGRVPSLPDLPVQYADYALWQQETLRGAGLEKSLAYWKRQLAGAPEFLELPTDHPRHSRQTFRGRWQSRTLPGHLAGALRELGLRQGATLFMTLLAAFKTLLFRYTQQEDILVGSPVAGRDQIKTENLIGFFVNALVLRTNLSGDPSFRQLLDQVRDVALGAYAHQDLPFDRLVEALHPERTASHAPLVQVLFVFQNDSPHDLKLPGLTVTPIAVDKLNTGTAKFDLTFQIQPNQPNGQGLTVAAEYNTDLFERDTITRILENFQTLLEGIVVQPDQKISNLPLPAPAERRRILVEWNDTATDYPRHKVIPQLCEEQVDRAPRRVALRAGATRLTYGGLDLRANRIAQALRARGVNRGQRVGLCVERGADMLAAMLGILKAGAAYVPLDPSFPENRLRFIAEDAQLSMLVSTASLAGPFGLPRDRQLLLDADAQVIASVPGTRLPADAQAAQPGDPAYVIHTSGSTGQPKGVVVTHRAVVNFLTSMMQQPGLVADDVLLAVTTVSFDIAALELYLPLMVGASIIVATDDEMLDGHALGALLDKRHATIMQATPVTWRFLLETGWHPRRTFKALVGGEALPEDLASKLIARGIELWNMYGPTETTVWSTCARITDLSAGITIGKPIDNTTIRILDARNKLCPIGVAGELCIGGDGVSPGYWNRPELTAEKFISDPYSAVPEARLYRTGDRARWRSDGTLEHLGRLDSQIKLRGFRIEPGEIETGIARHPAVREVAVIAREDSPGGKRLVAYLVAVNPPADLADQLRALLRTTMPEYMVPAHFVTLKALPRTPNGKLNRKALPAPALGNESAIRVAVVPRTPTEEMVMGVFRRVLDRTDIGVSDNFFDLGGHSLMAARLMFKLRAESGLDLPLRLLFERPTAAGLAEAVDGLSWLEKSNAPNRGNDAGRREEIEV